MDNLKNFNEFKNEAALSIMATAVLTVTGAMLFLRILLGILLKYLQNENIKNIYKILKRKQKSGDLKNDVKIEENDNEYNIIIEDQSNTIYLNLNKVYKTLSISTNVYKTSDSDFDKDYKLKDRDYFKLIGIIRKYQKEIN